MTNPLQRALDAISDGIDSDWAALQAQAADDGTRALLGALAEIAAIASLHAAGAPRPPRQTPFAWGSLEVRRWIARGAHGDVYHAWDPRLERDVALKLLRHSDGSADARAIGEGRLLAKVRHPNVVTVFGADQIDGQAGLWMEFLPGRTIADDVAAVGALPVTDVLTIARDVCAGLSAVHRAGLIHRDVKAHNVVRTVDGRTVLMDFGAGGEYGPHPADVQGTPVYLAPEILNGERPSIASEVYAVGVLLFLMATGGYPSPPAVSIDEIRRWHHRRTSDRLEFAVPVPAPLRRVIERAMARDARDRFGTIESLAAALALTDTRRAGYSRRSWSLAAALATAGAALVFSVREPRAALVDKGRVRMVRAPEFVLGPATRDGRFYPFVDAGGDVRLWNVATGAMPLIPPHPSDGAGVRSPLLSPDATRIARTTVWPDGGADMTVTGVDGLWPQAVILRQQRYEPVPVDWAPDGSAVLCWLKQRTGTMDLAVVPLSGLPPRILLSLTQREPPGARFSVDGRSVAAVRPRRPDDDTGQLVLVPAGGGEVRTLFDGQTADSWPIWTADGRLFFVRERADGTRDGWIARTGPDGRGQPPALAMQDIGRLSNPGAFAVTDTGELRWIVTARASEIYVAIVGADFVPRGAAVRIDPGEVGNHVAPAWSPDGRTIAYYTTGTARNPNDTPLKTLTFKDLASGRVRRLQLPVVFLSGYSPRWRPDSRALTVFASDTGEPRRLGYYVVDVATGSLSPLKITGSDGAPAMSQWSPDGRRFLFNDHDRGIVALDIATSSETVLVPQTAEETIGRFAISRGGRIAWVQWRGGPNGQRLLMIAKADATRGELVRADPGHQLELHGWTPDGRFVVYGEGRAPALRLWQLAASGGSPQDTHMVLPLAPNTLTMSPDGRRIAYVEQHVAPELWIRRLP